jgi:hypothetical protein
MISLQKKLKERKEERKRDKQIDGPKTKKEMVSLSLFLKLTLR